MNTMNFSPTIKQSSKIGPQLGVSFRYISEKYFKSICGVLVELNYANLGWKEKIEDGSGNTYSHGINYLQLPLLMQMGWGKERKGVKFVLEAGPQIGYAFSTSESRGGGEWNVSHRPNNVVYQYDHDIDNRFDYGLIFGGGAGILFGPFEFHLAVDYKWGLSSYFHTYYYSDEYWFFAYPRIFMFSGTLYYKF